MQGRKIGYGDWLVLGCPQITVKNVTVKDCSFSGKDAGHIEGAENWDLENIVFDDEEKTLTFGKRISSLSLKDVTCNGQPVSLNSIS